jgi:dephospho-CoA kinase
MIKVIGFVGKMYSGKTTGAKYLVETQQYTRLRVADGLKKMLRDGLGVPEEYIDGHLKNAECEQLCGVTARHAMITLGTEWGRNLIHPDLWVKTLDTQMRELMYRGHSKFVIDDIRFLNEAKWLKALNMSSMMSFDARLIRVLRKDGDNSSTHQSEVEQESIIADATIYNDYTLAMYYESINDIVSRRYDNDYLIDGNGFRIG